MPRSPSPGRRSERSHQNTASSSSSSRRHRHHDDHHDDRNSEERRRERRRSRSPHRDSSYSHRRRDGEQAPLENRDLRASHSHRHGHGKERERSRSRERTTTSRRDRSPSRSRSRSRSRDRRHRDSRRSSRRERSTSRGRDSASSGSDSDGASSSDASRKKRRSRSSHSGKHRSSRSNESDRDRRKRREEKKERKAKREAKRLAKIGIATEFGKFGVLTEADIYTKADEFNAWLIQEKMLNPETLSKAKEKEIFKTFMEDFNTVTLPHEKYYDMKKYESKMAAVRMGQTVEDDSGGYDFAKDLANAKQSYRKQAAASAVDMDALLMDREKLEELRRLQNERLEAQGLKRLGEEVKPSMGIRTEKR